MLQTQLYKTCQHHLLVKLHLDIIHELYPSATLQVNGVDMFYRVVFATYSGANAKYAMKFQVTKAGPDPEFTLVEGPTLQ